MEYRARCIYCGSLSYAEGWSENPDLKKEFLEKHGPGKCCSPCQYCREGVPHAISVCSDPLPISAKPFVRAFHDARAEERRYAP